MTFAERIRPIASDWAKAHDDIEEVILVGSYAWGLPNEESDVDLLVIAPTDTLLCGTMYHGWEETLSARVGLKVHVLSSAVPFAARGHNPKIDGITLYRRFPKS